MQGDDDAFVKREANGVLEAAAIDIDTDVSINGNTGKDFRLILSRSHPFTLSSLSRFVSPLLASFSG